MTLKTVNIYPTFGGHIASEKCPCRPAIQNSELLGEHIILHNSISNLGAMYEHLSANWQEEHAQVIRLEERLKAAKAQIDQTFYSDNEPGYTEGGDG